MEKISLIVPCYNESSPLWETYFEIKRVFEQKSITYNYIYEIIFVNDGSSDDTLDIIKEITAIDDNVKYISFTRNFGKESGMLAGLKYATGDAFIILDADLQHPPKLILEMIYYYEKGYEQVIAKRSRKGEKFLRKCITKLYYMFVNKVVDVELNDGIGDFRLLSKRVVKSLLSLPEHNRFSKGLFSWVGFNKKVIEYENQGRISGESKWSFSGLLNYAIDGITSFNSKPLRLIIYLGLLITLMSAIYIGTTFVNILLFGIETPGYFTLISSILLLGGIQLISIGILGEYLGRIFYEVKRRPNYIIDETNIEIKSNRTFKKAKSLVEVNE